MIEPRHLRVLREIARTGSFSAAARALDYTQPAVSQQVRALERTVGTAVVMRSTRGMVLTPAGEVLVRHAGPVLAGLAAAAEEVAAVAGLRAGRVRLAAFPSGSATLVPAALRALLRAHPGLAVSLVELEPPASVQLLRDGDCDVALTFDYDDAGLASPPEEDGLQRQALLSDTLEVVLPADHRLASTERLSLVDLRDEAWIAGCPRCRHHLVAACRRTGFEPRVTFATDDYVAVQSLVAAGLGVAMVPGLVLSAAHHAQVVVHRLDPSPQRVIAVVTTAEGSRIPAVGALVLALVDAAQELR